MTTTDISKIQPAPDKSFLLVGIGASAGGVGALQQLFTSIPADSGMAYAVVLHLSQAHESNLDAILQTKTQMPVLQVSEPIKVEPDHVYVIPPGKFLELVDGIIRLTEPERIEGKRVSIDHFFRTLADSYGTRAVSIILSGTGTDGTLGVKHIKERDGFAIVQDPAEAEYDGMPRSAIDTGLVDVVLPIPQMAQKLLTVRDSTERFQLASQDDKKLAEHIRGVDALRDIITMLRIRTGNDFSNYKQPTILRRIARHLQIHELDSLPDYLNLLRERPQEVDFLLNNLLINVTNFFRDREAFEVLEQQVIPKLFEGKQPHDTVRVWVAGCASGEEAYSMAILLAEYAGKISFPPKIQVFATDVDADAVAEARVGHYNHSIALDVSEERLARFFIKEEHSYRVRKDIRETILFAPHNILRDPPFSRLDMVSCRNVLIYLNRPTQEKVLQLFHFALQSHGFLFLGSSESANSSAQLFLPFDKKQRIYSYIGANLPFHSPPLLPTGNKWQVRSFEPASPLPEKIFSFGELHLRLIEQYSPPSVLVNEEFDIVHLSEHAGRYLRHTGGEPSNSLLKVLHLDLRADVRAALFAAQKENPTVEVRDVRVNLEGKECYINLTVHNIGAPESVRGFMLLLFEEHAYPLELPIENDPKLQPSANGSAMEAVVRRLDDELQRTKDRLRNTVEQYETSLEELKASNEELQAINEELRSASEELETSKEELQSVNEELVTVNYELKESLEDVSRAKADLQNLMFSTNIGTIFLDRNLQIKRFTPEAQKLFNVILTDLGRPIAHLTHRLDYHFLAEDAQHVLQTLQTVEREVRSKDGKWYLARTLPYRTVEDRIDGVVLTFVDITERKQHEEALRESEEKYRNLFDSIDEGYCIIEVLFDENDKPNNWRFLETNSAFEKQNGLVAATGKTIIETTPSIEPKWFEIYGKVVTTGEAIRFEESSAALNRWFDVYAFRVGDATSHQVAVIFNNITERKRQESNLTFLAEITKDLTQLTHISEIMNTVGAKIGAYLKLSQCAFVEINEAKGEGVIEYDWHRADMPSLVDVYILADFITEDFQKAARAGETVVIRNVGTDSRTDTEKHTALKVQSIVSVPFVKDGAWKFLLNILDTNARDWRTDEIELIQELTARIYLRLERARVEEALRNSEDRFRLASQAVQAVIYDWNVKTNAVERSQELVKLLGFDPTASEVATNAWYRARVHPDDDERTTKVVMDAIAAKATVFQDEHRVQHQDGHYVWVHDSGVFLYDADGNVIRCVGSITNITERKQAEEALRESEEKYRNLFNSMDQGFCVCEMRFDEAGEPVDYCFLELNPMYIKLTGLADAVGKTGRELIPNLEAKWFEIYGKVAMTGEAVRFESHLAAWNKWYDLHVSRVGKPEERKFAILFSDITERKAREQALAELNKQIERQAAVFEITLSTINDYVYSFDREGCFLYANQILLDLWGLTKEEAIGKTMAKLNYAKEVEKVLLEGIQQVFDTHQTVKNETFYTSPNGETGYFENLLSPVLSEDGTVEYVTGSSRNITDRKQAEQVLRDADRRKNEFLATLAHELRNPLTPIRSALEILNHTDNPAQAKQARAIIERQIRKIVILVDDLLEISRITRGKIQLHKEIISLQAVLKDVVETTEPLMVAAGHQFILQVPEELICIDADDVRIAQIIINIVNNAIKYTNTGGQISLIVTTENDQVVICIKDNGVGIPTDRLESIFEIFEQVEQHGKKFQSGLGIGLSLAKDLTELHGGTITAHSEGEGKGSEFTLRFPLAEDQTPLDEEPPCEDDPEIPAFEGNRKRIMVVEDDIDIADMLQAILELENYTVQTANSGESALQVANEFQPEAALVDIGLPDMDGHEVARRLRAQHPDLLLIAHSGWGADEDFQRSKEAGFDHHLVKPAEIEEIVALLSQK